MAVAKRGLSCRCTANPNPNPNPSPNPDPNPNPNLSPNPDQVLRSNRRWYQWPRRNFLYAKVRTTGP
eukprot:scaffold84823_cov36-Phaeocystis_antarctica.AAC.1